MSTQDIGQQFTQKLKPEIWVQVLRTAPNPWWIQACCLESLGEVIQFIWIISWVFFTSIFLKDHRSISLKNVRHYTFHRGRKKLASFQETEIWTLKWILTQETYNKSPVTSVINGLVTWWNNLYKWPKINSGVWTPLQLELKAHLVVCNAGFINSEISASYFIKRFTWWIFRKNSISNWLVGFAPLQFSSSCDFEIASSHHGCSKTWKPRTLMILSKRLVEGTRSNCQYDLPWLVIYVILKILGFQLAPHLAKTHHPWQP